MGEAKLKISQRGIGIGEFSELVIDRVGQYRLGEKQCQQVGSGWGPENRTVDRTENLILYARLCGIRNSLYARSNMKRNI